MRAAILLMVVACASQRMPAAQVTRSDDRWMIELTRSIGGYSADTATSTTTAPTRAHPVPHAGFAAARAWLLIAIAARSDDEKLAALAARAGLRELARDCSKCTFGENARFAEAAEHALAHGPMWAATNGFIAALEDRMQAYRRRFRGEVQGHAVPDAVKSPTR